MPQSHIPCLHLLDQLILVLGRIRVVRFRGHGVGSINDDDEQIKIREVMSDQPEGALREIPDSLRIASESCSTSAHEQAHKLETARRCLARTTPA